MQHSDVVPFYERLCNSIGFGFVGKLFIIFAPGLLFYIPHYYIAGKNVLHDYCWLLALLISASITFLFYATFTFKNLFSILDNYSKDEGLAYKAVLNSFLSDRNFIYAGVTIGIVNTLMGIAFGVPSNSLADKMILLMGYFIAGFVCGLPAWGILGVVATLNKFSEQADLQPDYTAPDKCGGVSKIGKALVKFSSVTLIEGILIAAYIILTQWTNASSIHVILLMWAWLFVPFIMSLIVLLMPALELNKMLLKYKLDKESALTLKANELRARIENDSDTSGNKSELITEYDYLCKRREEVNNMNTWPFGFKSTSTYVSIVIMNVGVAKELADSFIHTN